MTEKDPDKNRPEDPLEKLFREQAQEYDIPFREDDWKRLENTLELRNVRLRYRRRLAAVSAVALLLLSLLGYLTYENHQRINDLQNLLDSPITETGPPIRPLPDDLDGEPDTPQDIERNMRDDARADDTDVPPEERADAESQPELADSPETAETALETVENRLHYRHARIDPTPTERTARTDAAMRLANLTPERILLYRHTLQHERPTPTQMAVYQRPSDAPDPIGRDILATETGVADDDPRFAAGLAVSPDLSGAGGVGTTGRTGYKLGLSLEYRLTSRLAVAGGAIFSRTHYRAPGDAYRPGGYWTNGVRPDQITADCLILDIPLSLRLDLLSFERSRIFTSASVSSYIMLNEEYDFIYRQDSPDLPSGWNGRSGSFWLSHAGLSVGYELDVHRRWSLRAEPFLRMPIDGVGWGDIDLWTVGSFFSIQTRF